MMWTIFWYLHSVYILFGEVSLQVFCLWKNFYWSIVDYCIMFISGSEKNSLSQYLVQHRAVSGEEMGEYPQGPNGLLREKRLWSLSLFFHGLKWSWWSFVTGKAMKGPKGTHHHKRRSLDEWSWSSTRPSMWVDERLFLTQGVCSSGWRSFLIKDALGVITEHVYIKLVRVK